MTVAQALLIGFGYYLSQSAWLFGTGFFTLYRPLVAGLLVGLILGDPAQGTLIGAGINLIYLGFISAGGSIPGNPALAGWVATAVALEGGFGPGVGMVLAVPIGALGILISKARLKGDVRILHMADRAAAAADVGGVARANWLWPQLYLALLTFVPVALAVGLLAEPLADAIADLPAWLLDAFAIAGGLLPAIGIAMCMRFVFRGAAIPYFFVGFVVVIATGGHLSIVVVAILGAALATLHVLLMGDRLGQAGAPPTPGGDVSESTVTKRDVVRSWVIWMFFSHGNFNYERLQANGFAHAMVPIIKRLYGGDREATTAALQRHLRFFNTEPNVGGVVHGIAIGMEERKAREPDAVSDDAIDAVKTGLMGPVAGFGENLIQGTLTPLLIAIGIGVAAGGAEQGVGGNATGPVLYLVLVSGVVLTIAYRAYLQGWLRGREIVTQTLRSPVANRVLVGGGIVVCTVLGALAAQFVVVEVAPTITSGDTSISIQHDVLDAIAPGLLGLALVLGTWWLLGRGVAPLRLLIAFVALSVVCAIPFFGPAPERPGDACGSALLSPYDACPDR